MNILVVILGSLILSAFFSGMEIAFVSSNKLRIELDKKQGMFPSKLIEVFSKNTSQYLATMLIGNNIALVIYGLVMAQVLEPVFTLFVQTDGLVLLLQTIFSTLIILMFAEFLPKTLFRINPNQTLKVFAIPVYFFFVLLYPVARFTIFLSRSIIQLFFRVKISDEGSMTFGKTDLNHLVTENQSETDELGEVDHGVRIFQNALDFSSIKLRECIVPRTEIVAVSINDPVELLEKKFVETGLSKILVHEESIDKIIGYAHLVDLFQKPTNLTSIVKKIPIAPETMPANKLLALFIQNRKNIALVVDEFGGTRGIVTMEDILEEIIGDIQDEHDKVLFEEKQVNDTEFQFSGRLEIDYLNSKYNLELPASEDYETIAGLILAQHGSIPKANDTVIIDNLTFKILKVTSTKIELIHLKVL